MQKRRINRPRLYQFIIYGMAPKPAGLLAIDGDNITICHNPVVALPCLSLKKVDAEVATGEGPAINDGSVGVHGGSKQNEKQNETDLSQSAITRKISSKKKSVKLLPRRGGLPHKPDGISPVGQTRRH